MELKMGHKVLTMTLPGPHFEVGWVHGLNERYVLVVSGSRETWDSVDRRDVLANLTTGEVRWEREEKGK